MITPNLPTQTDRRKTPVTHIGPGIIGLPYLTAHELLSAINTQCVSRGDRIGTLTVTSIYHRQIRVSYGNPNLRWVRRFTATCDCGQLITGDLDRSVSMASCCRCSVARNSWLVIQPAANNVLSPVT
jgi:hypothetical protein